MAHFWHTLAHSPDTTELASRRKHAPIILRRSGHARWLVLTLLLSHQRSDVLVEHLALICVVARCIAS